MVVYSTRQEAAVVSQARKTDNTSIVDLKSRAGGEPLLFQDVPPETQRSFMFRHWGMRAVEVEFIDKGPRT